MFYVNIVSYCMGVDFDGQNYRGPHGFKLNCESTLLNLPQDLYKYVCLISLEVSPLELTSVQFLCMSNMIHRVSLSCMSC